MWVGAVYRGGARGGRRWGACASDGGNRLLHTGKRPPVWMISPLGNTTVRARTLSRMVPYRTALVPDALRQYRPACGSHAEHRHGPTLPDRSHLPPMALGSQSRRQQQQQHGWQLAAGCAGRQGAGRQAGCSAGCRPTLWRPCRPAWRPLPDPPAAARWCAGKVGGGCFAATTASTTLHAPNHDIHTYTQATIHKHPPATQHSHPHHPAHPRTTHTPNVLTGKKRPVWWRCWLSCRRVTPACTRQSMSSGLTCTGGTAGGTAAAGSFPGGPHRLPGRGAASQGPSLVPAARRSAIQATPYLQYPIHAGHVQADPAPQRRHVALQAGPHAERDDGRAVGRRRPNDAGYLLAALREQHRLWEQVEGAGQRRWDGRVKPGARRCGSKPTAGAGWQGTCGGMGRWNDSSRLQGGMGRMEIA